MSRTMRSNKDDYGLKKGRLSYRRERRQDILKEYGL
jgi:hypothetical protein